MAEPTNTLGHDITRQLRRLFYIARWLPGYGRSELRGDLIAGLTVGVMLIPQSMAYAVLAGLPPIYGLYASLIPLIIYPVFGTSRHLAVGIVAIDSLIVVAGLSVLAEPMSPRYVELALLLALFVGVLQMAMSVFRLGFVVNLLSRPVIAGFTAAAALIIAFSQLGSLLGLSLPNTSFFYVTLWEVVRRIGSVHPLSLAIGVGGIIVLLLVGRYLPRVPGPLVAVVLATLLVALFGLDDAGVAIVGEIPSGFPAPALPRLDADALRQLLPTAVTLALVQFMSVISLGKVFAARHRYTVRANRELFAMGAFNVLGAIFRGVPVSGSFSRSAVNEAAGARTALANAFAAGVIAITLLFLTPLFFYLPVPIFASIIIVAVAGLIDLPELRFLLRAKRRDGLIALLTFLATLFVGIQEGVLIGIGASVVAIMYRISRPNVAELGHLPGTRSFRDLRRYPDAEPIPGILLLRIDASFSFANADFLRDLLLERSQEDPSIRAVVIDASSINDLDTTAAAALLSAAETLQERGVELFFGGVKEPVQATMARSRLYRKLGRDHFFLSPHRAVKHILTGWGESAEYLEAVLGAEQPEDV